MLVSMDVINVNNEMSSHFESSNVVDVAPSILTTENLQGGKFEDRNDRKNGNADAERSRRKRKTRRFKSRYKNKSSKKSKYGTSKKMRSRVYPQSEAPNNTNQFLMADHNNLENLDDKLAVPDFARDPERSRVRESSFTSVDSDDVYYSSPEDDDDEYFTKDFDNTYQSVCAEKFGNLSKAQLTKIIFELEAKVEELSKKVVNVSNCNQMSNILRQVNGMDNKELSIEIKDIIHENERLRIENEELRRFIKENAVTTSSSSSSSSSGDSDSDSSENEDKNSVENRTVVENQRPSPNANDDLT